MKIDSAAGEFEFDLHDLKLADDGIILSGKMGVWEAETTMTDADLRRVIRLVLARPGAWGYLLRAVLGARKAVKQTGAAQ
mgnify:CR=1 FL=1